MLDGVEQCTLAIGFEDPVPSITRSTVPCERLAERASLRASLLYLTASMCMAWPHLHASTHPFPILFLEARWMDHRDQFRVGEHLAHPIAGNETVCTFSTCHAACPAPSLMEPSPINDRELLAVPFEFDRRSRSRPAYTASPS